MWRNWQTRTFEGRVIHFVWVQVPSSAPKWFQVILKPLFLLFTGDFFTGGLRRPSFLKERGAKNFIFAPLAIAPYAGAGLGVAVGVLLLSVLLRPSVFLKAGAFCATMNKESEGFFYVRKANFPTHGIVAGEESSLL